MRHTSSVTDPDIEDLRARIERLYIEAEDAAKGRDRLRIETIAAKIRVFEAALGELTSEGLHSTSQVSTMMSTKMASPEAMSGEEKRRFGIAKALASDHPFPQALIAQGSNVSKWAREHGLKRDEVKSWYSRHAPRPIPKKYARLIAKTLGLEPSKAVWPAGVKDE
jgi:lambda repressor-like predicted transcriptional regulator